MEHSRLVARLLNEVAAARATIMASYVRLWRSDAGSPADPSDLETGPEPRKPDVGSLGDERSRDVG